MASPERSPAYRMVQSFVGLAITVASLTALFLAMRAVMDIGGSCGSGGGVPPCPDGVALVIPASIFVGFGGLVLYTAGSSRLPGPRLVLLAWSALFLSLGFNFWDYGLDPPGQRGPEWGLIIPAVVFTLMGGLPLLGILGDRDVRRATFWADAPQPGARDRGPGLSTAVAPRRARAAAAVAAPPAERVLDPTRPDLVVDEQARAALDVAAALERASRLHREGALSDAEFEAAKDRILGGGS